jgi:hypothetical protein
MRVTNQKGKAITSTNSAFRQRGLGLLLTFVFLLLAASYFLLDYISPAALKSERERRSQELLYSARDALFAYALSAAAASQRPGDMPRPDVIADTFATRNYNGDAETGCFDAARANGLPLQTDEDTGARLRCLGRLPWRTLGLSYAAFSENDVTGVMPWYAVSANLATPNCLEYLNSEVLAFKYVGFICPAKRPDAPVSLPYPWLTVRDAAGTVLSSRVAVVVMMPGPAISGQSRPMAPNLAAADQYLDATNVTVTGVTAECPSPPCVLAYSNADLDNDFIQGTAGETFNDRLLYITIDELMAKVEERVGLEVKAALQRFSGTYSPAGRTSYPWLAPFANPNNPLNFHSVVSTRVGLIPFHSVGRSFTTDFTWTINNGSIPIGGTVSLAVVRNLAGVTISNGTCIWRSLGARSVDCVGTIANPAPPLITSRRVSITFPTTGTIVATPTPANASVVATRRVVRNTGSLAICLSTPNSCVTVEDFHDDNVTDDGVVPDPTPPKSVGKGFLGGGSGQLTVSRVRAYPELPLWYGENRWNELVLGAISEAYAPSGNGVNCDVLPGGRCLTVNVESAAERSDVKFLAILAGQGLAATAQKPAPQTRPSADPKDYFDSAANIDFVTGLAFDRTNATSNNFNDRVFY